MTRPGGQREKKTRRPTIQGDPPAAWTPKWQGLRSSTDEPGRSRGESVQGEQRHSVAEKDQKGLADKWAKFFFFLLFHFFISLSAADPERLVW